MQGDEYLLGCSENAVSLAEGEDWSLISAATLCACASWISIAMLSAITKSNKGEEELELSGHSPLLKDDRQEPKGRNRSTDHRGTRLSGLLLKQPRTT